jgi:RHS repeat-associated protein
MGHYGRLEAHEQSKGATSIYSLDMQYNQAGGITFKNSNGSGFMNASALTYNLEYTYVGKKYHQLDQVWDPTNGTLTKFTYNTSGSVTQIDDSSQPVAQDFFWNEQQQLTGVSNQQGVHHYVYDHSGERIMKSSLINTTVYLNDQVIDDVNNLDPYTVYVNPFYVVTGFQGGDRASKHYYMNQQRVATDITINYDPSGKGGGQQEQAKGSSTTETTWSPALTDFNEVLVGLGQKPLDTACLKLPTLASYYPEAATNPATSSSTESASTTTRILFWYHPDYLGNVDLITERDGYAHEFFMYNPWGEEMHQWNANTYAFTSPYRFNSKELDPETGLAYYGARYYQNKLGMWLSVDPLSYLSPNQSSFQFVSNNPILRIDPNGLTDFVNNETCEKVTVNDGMKQTINIMVEKWLTAVEYSKNENGKNPSISYNKFISDQGGNEVPKEEKGGWISDKDVFMGFMAFKAQEGEKEVAAWEFQKDDKNVAVFFVQPWLKNEETWHETTAPNFDEKDFVIEDIRRLWHTHPYKSGYLTKGLSSDDWIEARNLGMPNRAIYPDGSVWELLNERRGTLVPRTITGYYGNKVLNP